MSNKASEREQIIESISDALKKNDKKNHGTSSFINYAAQVYEDVFLTREQSLKQEHERALCAIEKPLKRIGNRTGFDNKKENSETGNAYYWDDVSESLETINRLRSASGIVGAK